MPHSQLENVETTFSPAIRVPIIDKYPICVVWYQTWVLEPCTGNYLGSRAAAYQYLLRFIPFYNCAILIQPDQRDKKKKTRWLLRIFFQEKNGGCTLLSFSFSLLSFSCSSLPTYCSPSFPPAPLPPLFPPLQMIVKIVTTQKGDHL